MPDSDGNPIGATADEQEAAQAQKVADVQSERDQRRERLGHEPQDEVAAVERSPEESKSFGPVDHEPGDDKMKMPSSDGPHGGDIRNPDNTTPQVRADREQTTDETRDMVKEEPAPSGIPQQ